MRGTKFIEETVTLGSFAIFWSVYFEYKLPREIFFYFLLDCMINAFLLVFGIFK